MTPQGTKTRTASSRTAAGRTSAQRSRATRATPKRTASKTSGARTPASRTSAAKPSASKATSTRSPAARSSANGATVKVPVVTPHVRMYKVHVPVPGKAYMSDAGHIVAGYMPPPDRMAFYGGLGLAAVVGLLDWPVAAAIGVGTMVARRATRSRTTART